MTTNKYLFPFFGNPSLINKLVEVLGVDINSTTIKGDYLIVEGLNEETITKAIDSINNGPLTEELKTYTVNYVPSRDQTLIDFLYKSLYKLNPNSVISVVKYTHDLINKTVTAKYVLKTRDNLQDLLLASLTSSLSAKFEMDQNKRSQSNARFYITYT